LLLDLVAKRGPLGSFEELSLSYELHNFTDTTVTAEFMHKVGRINKKPSSWKDLFFDNVHSLSGS
jgi:hypothetical protein